MAPKTTKSMAERKCLLAHKAWESGHLKLAFRRMLQAAEMRDLGAQLNTGFMFDQGIGVQRNRTSALYWYKREYRRGDACAAHNIGTVWRDERHFERALYWFRRAIALNKGDDGDASLEIAKIYLYQQLDSKAAKANLKKVRQSKNVTDDSVEKANRILRQIAGA